MYFMINNWITVLINLSFWSGSEALTWKRLKPRGESSAVFCCRVVFKGVSKCKLHPSQTKMQLLGVGAWLILYLFMVYFNHCATSQYNRQIVLLKKSCLSDCCQCPCSIMLDVSEHVSSCSTCMRLQLSCPVHVFTSLFAAKASTSECTRGHFAITAENSNSSIHVSATPRSMLQRCSNN